MSNTWLLIDSGPGEPAFNMALDEALLESASLTARPVLRFYGWTQPAASFGYFQKICDVESATLLRPLIRRPTGGGIVPHDTDWTYSVAIPAGHEWYRLKAVLSYRRMHEWICRAFKNLGIDVYLAQDAHHPRPGECFAGHEIHDALWQGRKIAGAAQRRTRNGLLIQGSVQSTFLKVNRNAWQQAMAEVAEIPWAPGPVSAELMERSKSLVLGKYGTDTHNRRR
jgi:lipoate-protein ligase A